jgi:TonB family protein
MTRDARFWRNVALIAVVHLALLLAFARASRESDRPNLQNIVWMSAEAANAAAKNAAPERKEAAPETAPSPVVMAKAEERSDLPTPTPAKSDIVMPSPTPTATRPPKPSPTATAKPSPKPAEKPSPKASPKKSATPKPAPKESPKQEKDSAATPKPTAEKKASAKEPASSPDKSSAEKSPGAGSGSGSSKSSEFAWYGSMLHDRFYKAWDQPTSSVASGAKMSTIVKIRIEKDGRVSKFTVVKPSGSVVVDESVGAIAKRVTQVDPLPEGLAKGAYYEVKIDFELNAEK